MVKRVTALTYPCISAFSHIRAGIAVDHRHSVELLILRGAASVVYEMLYLKELASMPMKVKSMISKRINAMEVLSVSVGAIGAVCWIDSPDALYGCASETQPS